MDSREAKDLVERSFSFDKVGPAMMKVRKNLDDKDLQAILALELSKAASQGIEDLSEDDKELLDAAAKERVSIYVASSKSASGTGCG